jgi:hypothetical protein
MARRVVASVVVAVACLSFGACSDDTKDKVKDAAKSVREDAENAAGTAAAYGVAQSFRAAIKAKDLPDGTTARDVSVLNDVARDLPGDPDIRGITDSDGDGKDDDGRVEVHVGGQAACVTINADGSDTKVEKDACKAS